MHEPPKLANKLEAAINNARADWYLCIVGEDESNNLQTLVSGLTEGKSDTGDGKRIESGLSYWGMGPTLAWETACNDRTYHVMRDSIESFPERWKDILPHLGSHGFHYVSLGPGTGVKDVTIVKRLVGVNPGMCYFPVDLSPEMLTVGMQEIVRQCAELRKSQILPIQLDFSREKNVRSLRSLLDELVSDEPILFSLLGNTMANFDNDSKLLKTLALLVRPQDRFLVEVAYTATLDDDAAELAAREYQNSEKFKTFVLSSLMQNTTLAAFRNYVSCVGEIEENRSLRIKVLYQNKRDSPMSFVVFQDDDHNVEFPAGDTIRLYLTRKYTQPGLEALMKQSKLSILQSHVVITAEHERKGREYQFGIQLLLLTLQSVEEGG